MAWGIVAAVKKKIDHTASKFEENSYVCDSPMTRNKESKRRSRRGHNKGNQLNLRNMQSQEYVFTNYVEGLVIHCSGLAVQIDA